MEPSYVPCENLIVGRLSFKGMNPEIERILELEEEAERAANRPVVNEADVSDIEMANRYNSLVGTISKKFSTKVERRTMPDQESKPKFLKPMPDE